MRLSGLGSSGLSSCSFCRNSWGRRMSAGRESLLLMSCSGQDETWAAGAVRPLPLTLGPAFPVGPLRGAKPQAATQAPSCLNHVLRDLHEDRACCYVSSGGPFPSLPSVPTCALRVLRTL